MRNIILYLYYFILTIVLVLWSDTLALPPLPLRLVFLVLVVAPLFLFARDLFVVVFSFFVILSSANHAVSYMPATGPSVVICTLVGVLFFRPSNTISFKPPVGLWLLFLLTIIIDLIYGGTVEDLSYSLFFLIIVLWFYFSSNHQKQTEQVAYSFIFLSLILSVEYLIWGEQFSSTVFVGDEDFVRFGWSDPNYFSCTLGFGALISYRELLDRRLLYGKKSWLLLLTVILSLYVIIESASRGATIALVVAICVSTLFSKISVLKKVVILVVGAILVSFSLKNGVFDLLLNRVVNDDGTAGDRTLIWTTKLNAFFQSEPLDILLGYGIKGGRYLGFSKIQGFHNDFIAFLISYGIVGLVLFVSVLLSPLFERNSRILVFPYLLYVYVVCMSLEPFSSGYYIYFYFLLFVYLLGTQSKQILR